MPVVVCDLETSRMGAPYIYIYIYDISRLRVKYVCFPRVFVQIHLMVRKNIRGTSGGVVPNLRAISRELFHGSPSTAAILAYSLAGDLTVAIVETH